MKTYRIIWSIKTPFETELHSDTIFGHLCWAIRYIYGEQRLIDVITELKKEPLWVISNAFPIGKLPEPTIPRNENKIKSLKLRMMQKHNLTELQWYEERKRIKEKQTLDREQICGIDKEYNWMDEIEKYWDSFISDSSKPGNSTAGKTETVFHNTINRLTGTTAKGDANLFTDVVTYMEPGYQYESYMDTDLLTPEELKSLFKFIEQNGFGKNKNTGNGRFQIYIEEYGWQTNPQYNAFLILSNMVPDTNDSTDFYGSSFTRFGKLGGNYAVSSSPFKYPLYIIKPGAVFRGDSPGTKPRGCLLTNIHPGIHHIVQNLYAYSIPIKIKELL